MLAIWGDVGIIHEINGESWVVSFGCGRGREAEREGGIKEGREGRS